MLNTYFMQYLNYIVGKFYLATMRFCLQIKVSNILNSFI